MQVCCSARGSCILYLLSPSPFSVLVFALAAGASIVGAEDLVAAITAGTINFTKCIATPDMMPLVGRVARVRVVSRLFSLRVQQLCVCLFAI